MLLPTIPSFHEKKRVFFVVFLIFSPLFVTRESGKWLFFGKMFVVFSSFSDNLEGSERFNFSKSVEYFEFFWGSEKWDFCLSSEMLF